jgi:hypothetical protein
MVVNPRALFLSVCFLMLPLVARSQQSADSTFNTNVARPMFTTWHPKLLVDLGHHNTHTTRQRYDALAKMAKNDGFEVIQDLGVFTPEDMSDINVLLIANPLGTDDMKSKDVVNSAFTPEECNNVYNFVAAGGSLLFICEHTPMSMAGRFMAERFGVKFGNGFLIDPVLADTTYGASTLVFSRATGTLGNHITLRGRGPAEEIKRIRTYTGQSIVGPAGSVPLLKVTDKAQDLEIGPQGMTGTVPEQLKRSAAGRTQGVAFTVGKGRVVVLGETSMFSTQLLKVPGGAPRKVGMNAPGCQNRQFALNVLHWLAKGLN